MNITIKVTKEKKYINVIDIDTSDMYINAGILHGTLSIETEEGIKDFTGEHGLNDYEDVYGFVLVIEYND